MTTKQKIQANTEAIRVVLENKSGTYTDKQIEIVKGFSGWGSCKQLVWSDGDIDTWKDASATDKVLYLEYRKLYDLLDNELTGREYKAALESMRNATMTSFYTDPVVPRTFYEVLNKYIGTQKQRFYDPSAGTGVFTSEWLKSVKGYHSQVTMYEKDLLTYKVLKAIMSKVDPDIEVIHDGFENSKSYEDAIYDIVCTNPPYGAFPVYDPSIPRDCTTRIHNYFVAKGIDKLKDGGVMGLLITNAFLDTILNRGAREYLFNRCDFISLTVMPDNLMKESAGTEAGSHFLVIRKHTGKTEMSEEEKLLCVAENVCVTTLLAPPIIVSRNRYIQAYETEITIGSKKVGKNQYGKPAIETWWNKPMQDIAESFREILSRGFEKRYKIKEPVEGRIENGEIVGGYVFIDLLTGKKINDSTSNELPPWDELPDHIQVTEEEYQIEDEEEIAASLEESDKPHIRWGDRLDQKFERDSEGIQDL